jgi:hypothetical protein
MDRKEREGKAKSAPWAEFIARVLINIAGNIQGLGHGRGNRRVNCLTGIANGRIDGKRIGELLRKLPPEQEKVVRLYFGLGCKLPIRLTNWHRNLEYRCKGSPVCSARRNGGWHGKG